jgi:hypothetical protein
MTLVLLGVLVLMIMGSAIMGLDVRLRSWATMTAAEIASRTAADAGLTKAVASMNDKLREPSWDDANLPAATLQCLENCDATYSFHVAGDVNTTYTVDATGNSGAYGRTVNATLKLRSLFENTIYAKSQILLDGNAHVYTQDGSVAIDPSGQGATIDPSSSVDGEILKEPWDLPAVPLPTDPVFDVDKGAILETRVLRPSDSGRYQRIGLYEGEKLTIDCNEAPAGEGCVTLYVTGNIALMRWSQIEVRPNSSLVIYLEGDFTSQFDSAVNQVTQDASRCVILGNRLNQVFYLDSDSDFWGVVYAPQSTVFLGTDVDFTGAIVGSNVMMQNNSTVTYDESIVDMDLLEFGFKFVVDRWWQGDEW